MPRDHTFLVGENWRDGGYGYIPLPRCGSQVIRSHCMSNGFKFFAVYTSETPIEFLCIIRDPWSRYASVFNYLHALERTHLIPLWDRIQPFIDAGNKVNIYSLEDPALSSIIQNELGLRKPPVHLATTSPIRQGDGPKIYKFGEGAEVPDGWHEKYAKDLEMWEQLQVEGVLHWG